MNRATLLAFLLLLVVAVAFRSAPGFAVDGPFAALELPEQLPSVVSEKAPPSLVGAALMIVTASLIIFWRRAVGQGPLLSLLPSLVLLFHPALALAPGSERACIELSCLALCVLGAWLMTFGRSSASVVGAVLGFVAVLIAPSGAALAALFAFALAEAEPGLPGAAVFASLYGVARAFALPSLLGFIPALAGFGDPVGPPEAPFVALAAPINLALAAASIAGGLVHSGLSWVAVAPAHLVGGWVLLAALLFGAVFLPAEKRFGGRAAPLLALVAIVLLAIEQARRGFAPSAALAPIIVLVTLWIATLGDVVDGGGARRVLSVVAAVAALVFVGAARFLVAPELATPARRARTPP
jgi:hypothetical protein